LWLIDIALIVANRVAPELIEAHVEAALDAGTGPDQIDDVLAEAALYSGVAAVENAIGAAYGVFARRGLSAGATGRGLTPLPHPAC
jgi:alkylhydroperoxidase/carboxymuconolactone decarboxylase family protein YurZ